jgi:redox-sensitive bicupin YhaK (pirin superfamily)
MRRAKGSERTVPSVHLASERRRLTIDAMTSRPVQAVITSHRQTEGGGFVVRRPFPTRGLDQVDPFLLLDELGPIDYAPGEAIGAPDHPHRGFETVTYVLSGENQHEDSAGHKGKLGPGDVQWMTAGRGVVHSEEPSDRVRAEGGRAHGFQIWVNLPAKDKMMAPRYQEIPAAQIPSASRDGATVKVIAGEALGVRAVIDTVTPITYQHWTRAPGASVYVFEAIARIGSAARAVRSGQLALLGDGDSVELAVSADAAGPAQLLLLAGRPIGEPIARMGPFVMNTEAEIRQAIADFQSGRMGAIERA